MATRKTGGSKKKPTRAGINVNRIGAYAHNEPIPEEFFEKKAWRTKWRYIYNFRYQYYDKINNRWISDWFAIARKDRVSLDALQHEVRSMIQRIAESLKVRTRGVKLMSGVQVVRAEKKSRSQSKKTRK